MKILVVTQEAWRTDNNGGNVLTNIFEDFNEDFAQVYCSSEMPMNDICKNYFQITDDMVVRNFLHHTETGRHIPYAEITDAKKQTTDTKENEESEKSSLKKLIGRFKGKDAKTVRAIRDFIWVHSDFRNERLRKFVEEYSPDIIFAPCYEWRYMALLVRYIKKNANCPVISYVSDDVYSMKQVIYSPAWWINHVLIRGELRKTWPMYSLVYTMTQEQMQLYKRYFHRPMKILCKSGMFDKAIDDRKYEKPYRIIYAGGIYYDRWKMLGMIAREIENYNSDHGMTFKLDIFTLNRPDSKMKKAILRGNCIKLHNAVSQDELRSEYEKSDIALHVEAPTLQYRLVTRLSFSTKIIDCLDSGCAVMAVCDKKQAGFTYLKREDAALCASDNLTFRKLLKSIDVSKGRILKEYAKKAQQCGKRNHNKETIAKGLYRDFLNISREQEV